MRTPVLAVTVTGDTYTPPGTTGHLVGKLAAAPVTREVHPGPDHFRDQVFMQSERLRRGSASATAGPQPGI